MSGIKILPNVLEQYEKLQKKHELKYIIFKIGTPEGGKDDVIYVDCAEPSADKSQEEHYDDFLKKLQEKPGEGRYAVFDFDCGDNAVKIVFIAWVPDGIKVKQKMLYASSKEAIKAKLDGIKVYIQASDSSEITEEAVRAKCLEKSYR
ncbi:actophorin-like [Lingula anatina]|nr:actophorin-like [Lingula anatina]|eukprot:XP_013393067.1 actophorin-like [Lingula anatina]